MDDSGEGKQKHLLGINPFSVLFGNTRSRSNVCCPRLGDSHAISTESPIGNLLFMVRGFCHGVVPGSCEHSLGVAK